MGGAGTPVSPADRDGGGGRSRRPSAARRRIRNGVQPERRRDVVPRIVPIPDRWRIKPPPYEKNVEGHWWDPYNLNTLKGDYPILRTQDLFLRLTAATLVNIEGRSFPIPSGVSAKNPGSYGFFGNNELVPVRREVRFQGRVFQGNTAFKPPDFQVTVEGVVDVQNLKTNENAVVDVDVREGINRWSDDAALQQAFVEYHLVNVSNRYDFISVKVGRQPFNSDFRSLIFSDTNQVGRLFGSADGNRYQWNLVASTRRRRTPSASSTPSTCATRPSPSPTCSSRTSSSSAGRTSSAFHFD